MIGLASAGISLVKGFLEGKREKARAREEAEAKIKVAKVDGANQVTMSHLAWEQAAQKNSGTTWKDEFVTIVVYAPFLSMFVGAIAGAFGHQELASGTIQFLQALRATGVEYGDLLMVVTLAAIGLRAIKR